MADKKIYTVATSHLDTVWSWDFETTVSKYIYNTLVDNFKLFEKYPTYKFSFEGSYRYELMEEYYPELFEKMKEYIKNGRWNVCGSAFENGDTIFRHLKRFSEIFFSAIRILMKSLEKEVLISTCPIVSFWLGTSDY